MSRPLEPGCVERCPGCDFRSFSTEESARRKMAWLGKALASWSSALEPLREATEAESLGYRERTALRTEWDGTRWRAGLLRRDRESDIEELVAIPECPVHSERARRAIEAFCAKLPGPPELSLAFVVVSGELLTLVLRDRALPSRLVSLLDPGGAGSAIDPGALGLKGVFANLNPSAGTRVHSNRDWHLLWGRESATRDGLEYGPRSFQQLIPRLSSDALAEAETFLAPQAGDRVLDLCSGIGASVVRWRARGASSIGVELGGEASGYLERNAGPGASLRGRASERIPQLATWLANPSLAAAPSSLSARSSDSSRVLAYVNPPRLGLEPEVLEWLAREARPERLAYLSCSAGTLARDLGSLNERGYRVQRIIPYDFFPRTRHVETLVLLQRE